MREPTLGSALGIAPAPARVADRRRPTREWPDDDPRRVGDPELDAVIGALIDDGVIPDVNARLAAWTRNADAVPDGLPEPLAEFLSRAVALPPWADRELLGHAGAFAARHERHLMLLYGLGGGILGAAIPRAARAVYWSATPGHPRDRATKTLTFGRDLCAPDPFGASGAFVVTALKTRMIHAAARHLLQRSTSWRATTQETVAISTADLLAGFHSTATLALSKLEDWGIPIADDEAHAFLHSWQLALWLLGVDRRYIPDDWPSARAQAARVLTPVLDRSDEGHVLAERLLDLTAGEDPAISRGFLNEFVRYQFGNAIGEWLGLARDFESARVIRRGWRRHVAGGGDAVPGSAAFVRLTAALTAAFDDRAGSPRGSTLRIPDGSGSRWAPLSSAS